MILQALHRLADQEGLVEDPDYEIKRVSWAIWLSADGTLLQISDLRRPGPESGDRHPKLQGRTLAVPRQPIRTAGDCPFFLVDKSEYTLRRDPTGQRPAEKLERRFTLFRDQVDACARAMGDATVGAVAAFLRDIDKHAPQIEQAFQQQPWAANDLFAFQVGVSAEFVHLRPAVRQHWIEIRAQRFPDADPRFRCLVTGAAISEPSLFPLLKGVPGGAAGGVSLVSFNAEAFESYGLIGNQNAPISRAAAEKAVTALNRLLHAGYPSPSRPGATLPRRHVQLRGDTVACVWTASNDADANGFVDTVLDLLEGDNEDRVAAAYRSLWRSDGLSHDDRSAFYLLVLSGARGRAVVRAWMETTVGQARSSLRQHFADLQMVRSARLQHGTPPPPVIPIRWLMGALASNASLENLPASLAAEFVQAMFSGRPYPFHLLQCALVRARAEARRNEWCDAARQDARAALIRAVLNRRRVFDHQAQQRYPEVPVAMNPHLQSEGYLLGLLMAVLERLQGLASRDIQGSIIHHDFAAGSTTPPTVFARLLKNGVRQAHRAAMADDLRDRWMAARLWRLIDYLCRCFQPNREPSAVNALRFPAHLGLEQQGLFVLSYHQMRYWLGMSRPERLQWEQEHGDAPRAFLWIER